MVNNSIKRNFAYQMIYQILAIILPLITSPYIARVIGVEGLGMSSYASSVAYYFVLFSMLGLANYGNRTIAQVRENRKELNTVFSSVFAVHALISLFFFLAYMIYVYVFTDGEVYALIQTAYVLSALFDISWFYFGIEKFKLTATVNTIIKILNVACVFIFVRDENDLWKYCTIYSVGTLLGQLVLWLPLKKYVTFEKVGLHEMVQHIKPMFVLFVPAVAISLYKYMDKIMLGTMSSKTQLGFYENAEKLINIPLAIIISFGTVMLPKISNLAAMKDMEKTKQYLLLSMKYVMCMAFALAFGLAGVAKVFAPVFWGEEFTFSGVLIMGLAITLPFISFANVIRTQYLIPMEKDKEYLISVIVGAVINLIINFSLIPKLGAIGATIGTIFAEMTVCIIQIVAVRKELPIGTYFKNMMCFCLFGIVMFVAVLWLGDALGVSVMTLIIQIMLGVVVYCLACLIYFYIKKDEMIIGIIHKFRR